MRRRGSQRVVDSEAELRHHLEVVADGVVVDEQSISEFVPVDVRDLEVFSGRGDADKLAAVDR